MKRYLIFGYDQYYPSGGESDVIGNADTIEEVREVTSRGKRTYDSVDVLDMQDRCWLKDSLVSKEIVGA